MFSFKNTLEITAYSSLEAAYSLWDWTFQEGMLSWEHKAENIITTAPINEVAELVEKKKVELVTYALKEYYEPLKLQIENFFKGKQSEILAQWKMKFQTRFDHLASELQEHARNHCIKLGKSRVAISKIEKERKEYSEEITKGVQEYIAFSKLEQEKLNQNLEKRKLESSQLQEILLKKLFTPTNLLKYREQNIITQAQEIYILGVIKQCGGHLTPKSLNTILVGGVLAIEDTKKILQRGQKTEEELKQKFEQIWDGLINQISFVSGEEKPVYTEVRNKLFEIARSQGFEGQLIGELKEKQLMKWGPTLEIIPEETIHYEIIQSSRWNISRKLGQLYTRVVHGKKVEFDPYRKEALEIAERVLNEVRNYMKSIEDKYKDADFNPAYIQELLRTLSYEITKESATSHEHIKFTVGFRLHVYLIACAYAVPIFKTMRKSFMERNDPRLYLEKHLKDPLYTRFKNQYYQTEAEEAIANTLCAHLTEPIKTQIGKLIGAKMVTQMRGSQPYFSSKIALKVKILKDFHEEKKFESYMEYITDVKKCLQRRIEHYTISTFVMK